MVVLLILHHGNLLFLIRHNLMFYQSLLPTTQCLYLYFQGLKRENKFSEEKFCYKICCEIEPLLLMGLATSHKSIEWLRWENMQPVTPPAAADLYFLDKSRTECWQSFLASHKDYRWGRLLDTGSLSGDAGCCQQRRKWLPHLQTTGFLICSPGSL